MRFPVSRLLAAACGAVLTTSAFAMPNPNLQISEVMYNTKNTTETLYGEWVEIRNTSGSPIDLDGYYLQRVGATVQASFNPVVRSAVAANTIVPANGVAVLYDGFIGSGSAFNYNDDLFRETWGLSAGVSLIAGDFFPSINNSAASYGLWATVADAVTDGTEATAGSGIYTINSTTTAATAVTYDIATPWPANTDGVSIQWNGTGDRTVGSSWYASATGVNGAVTSLPLTRPGTANGVDVASPGTVPATASGTIPTKIVISEIMYNPASSDQQWEWVEIYNNTGLTIDFGVTPYYLDDDDGNRLGQATGITSAPNINSGSIPQGGVAVLFNDEELDITTMQAAWGASVNFISVNKFNEGSTGVFANGANATTGISDLVGLWSSQANYEADQPLNSDPITTTNTASWLAYGNNSATSTSATLWPNDTGSASITLTDLSLDQNLAGSWANSELGINGAVNPTALTGTITIHPGGDIASPGNFTAFTPVVGINGDYNDDGTVDAADYTEWRDAAPTDVLPNDATPGSVAQSDYDVWVTNFGMSESAAVAAAAAVPEPATLLLALPLVGLALRRRK